MKSINEKFTDSEFKEICKVKLMTGLTWHDFLLEAVRKIKYRYGDD